MTGAYAIDGRIVALVDEDGVDEADLVAVGINPDTDRIFLVPVEARIGDDLIDWT